MGIQRGFYHRFARRLAAHGLSVLTVDWRGIGGSAIGRARDCPARLADWGEKDLSATIECLVEETEPESLAYVGHSLGGAVLGLTPSAKRFERILLVAAQNGYWKHWDGLSRLVMLGIWSIAIPAATVVFGCLPRWALGGQCDVPAKVARDWARWGRHPGHVLSQAPEVRERFASLSAPVRAYAISDDWFAPRRATERAKSYFPSALVERVWLTPKDLGVNRIGHFGFFRPELAVPLWGEAAEWLALQSGE